MEMGSVFPFVLGILLAFLGYPIYRISIKIAGFIIGFFVGITLTYFVDLNLYKIPHVQIVMAAAGLLLGLMGAMTMQRWVRLLLFVGGFSLGMALSRGGAFTGHAILPSLAEKFNSVIHGVNLYALVLGIVLGLVAVILEKFFVVMFTGFWGAALVSSQAVNQYVFPFVLFAGIIVQFILLAKSKRKKES